MPNSSLLDGPLLERLHNKLGRGIIAEPVQDQGDVGLRLPAERRPVLASLAEEVIDRRTVPRGDGMVFQEETPTVQIERDDWCKMVFIGVFLGNDPFVQIFDPRIKSF